MTKKPFFRLGFESSCRAPRLAAARGEVDDLSSRSDAGFGSWWTGEYDYWLPAGRGCPAAVSDEHRWLREVWLSYSVSDQKFASGIPLGNVTL